MTIDTIPHDITARAAASRDRALLQIQKEDLERAERAREDHERLERQVHAERSKVGARRAELERRRVYLANLRIEVEQVEHQLQLPTQAGVAVIRSKHLELHSLELGRVVGAQPGDLVCVPTVPLARLRETTNRNVTPITPEALAHLLETGAAEAAPEVTS
ncbi:MAG: hypothetical protein JW940_00495 [Polyangiaceae bacterium]|nr:hypothetical protein [Polyangiaceae bacterium]